MEIYNEIKTIIDWYNKLPVDYTGLNELIHKRDRLATFYFTFSTELGNLEKSFYSVEAEYENEVNEMSAKLILENQELQKSKTIAKANNQNKLVLLKDAQGLMARSQYQFRAIKEVLSAMNQKIADLRYDKQLSKNVFS